MRVFSLTLLLTVLLVALNGGSDARAAGVLTVEIIAAPNLVVDSNVLSPSTYSPDTATVIGKFCNTGDTTLSGVQGFIGDYSGATPDPGNYPAYIPPASDTTFYGWGQDNSAPSAGFYFEHVGGSLGMADASRIIGDIPAGECAYQYWHFTYPNIAYDGGSGTKPTWGNSIKPYDDLSLDFWIWGQAEGGSAVKTSHTMTMRNEISAMANKIEPNDGLWFNTGSSVVNADEYIVSNGINYDLGNINQGFDNDGDGDYDYNAWLQPFGNSSFDPGCFQMVKSWGTLTLRRSGGQPDLVIPFEDKLYFTDEDYLAVEDFDTTTITTGVGEVHYKFKALKADCYVDFAPYQEVASGADNEKFNADYGAGITGIHSSEARIDIDKSGDVTSAGPSETITYTLNFTNNTGTALEGLTLSTNPMPLTLTDNIPDGTTYVLGSADGAVPPAGTENSVNTDIYYSSDGVTWSATEGAVTPIRYIQWWLDDTVSDGATAYIKFQVTVDSDYDPLPTGDGPVMENCVEAGFGGAGSFAESCSSTIYKGTSSVTALVWEDENSNGVYESGTESIIPYVTVWLYIDLDGDGIIDDTDPLVMTDLDVDGDGSHTFSQLPAGNYIVKLNSDDDDIPVGLINTTASQFHVDDLAAGESRSFEFGFGPVINLTKTLTSHYQSVPPSDPSYEYAYEGDTVTFVITLENLLPGGESGTNKCVYTIYPTSVDEPPDEIHYGINAGSRFLLMNNALGAPDNNLATTDFSDSNDTIGLIGFLLGEKSGNIEKVELLIYAVETAPLDRTGSLSQIDKLDIEVYYNIAGSGDPSFYNHTILSTDFVNGIGEQQIFTFDITNSNTSPATTYDPTDDPWDWTHFGSDLLEFVAVSDKAGGTVGDIGIDAVALQITTDDTSCGGADGTIQYLPLEDTYDTTYLEFIEADPLQSSPLDGSNPGTITWNDLGPLAPGEIKTIEVTFQAKNFTSASDITTINNTESDGGTFEDGSPIHDPATPLSASDDVTIRPTGSIGDYIWSDWHNTGVQDTDESGIEGITVNLVEDNNCDGAISGPDSVITSTATDENGYYLFEGLADDCYTVQVIPGTLTQVSDPDGTLDNLSGAIQIVNGSDYFDKDFGYTGAPKINGSIWNDWNQSGTSSPDTGEGGIGGVTVYAVGGGCVIPACPSGITDANGDFVIDTGLTAGTTYTVTVDPSSALYSSPWYQSFDTDGTGSAHTITLTNLQGTARADYSYYQTGVYDIGDLIWLDYNGDGVQDALEIPIDGVTVRLYVDSDGDGTVDPATDALVVTQVTSTVDADTNYLFEDLPDREYLIIVDESTLLAAGYTQTGDPDESGTCTTCDGQSNEFTPSVLSAADRIAFDFGYQPYGLNTVGDLLFVDMDGDGNYEPTNGDYGINGGIQVELYKNTSVVSLASQQNSANPSFETFNTANDPLIATTMIDANGNYIFTNLPDGYYWIKVPSMVTFSGIDYFPSTINPYHVVQICVDGTYTNLAPNIDVTTGAYDADYDGDGDTEPPPTDSNWCDAQSTDEGLGTTISSYEDADFGYTPGASVGDTIWLDTNRNGSKDDKDPSVFYEPGIQGVEVTLTGDIDGDGDIDTLTDTTDANGNYLFENLHPGNYTIEVTNLSGALVGGVAVSGLAPTYDPDEGVPCSTCDETTSFTLSPGQYDPSRDFGYAPFATIGDTLWLDSYNQGTLDAGEARLPGVTVNLRDCSAGDPTLCEDTDSVVQTTITDENGEYAFAVYELKYYQVEVPTTVIIPDSGVLSLITQPWMDGKDIVVVSASGDYLDSDFGYDSDGENDLSGYVYYDVENIGTYDAGEPVYENVTVNLFIKIDDNGTSGDDSDDTWALFDSTQTNASGHYEFTGLNGGDYRVQYDTTDSRLSGLGRTQPTGTYYEILDLSEPTADLNFGFRASSIGDLVWADADGEGDQDEVGAGIAGITVELYLDDGDNTPDPGGTDGAPIQTTQTDANGEYLFYGLDAGPYFVKFINPGNYAFSPKDATGVDTTDSDADTSTGVTDVFTLGTDEYQGTWDAGLIGPSITLDKDPDTQTVASGGTASFTFSIMNDGGAPLTSVTPSDARCTTALTQTASGNGDAILDVGETWSYACDTVDVTIDFNNTASVTAKDPLNNDVTASDTVSVTVTAPTNPAIGVDKKPATQSVTYNGTASFTFDVTNTGDVPLNTVGVTDTHCDAVPTTILSGGFNVGDANTNNLLDMTETWQFECEDTNVTNGYANTATASGVDDVNGGAPVTATDTSDVSVTTSPAIEVTKVADSNPVAYDGTVTFTISVDNFGDVPLDNLSVTDAQCDAAPTPTLSGGFNIGDTNTDNRLDMTESWTYTCSKANVQTAFDNVVNAAGDDIVNGGTVSDGYTLSISIQPPLTGTIGDYVWNDADGEGDQDEGIGLSGVRVYLDLNGNYAYDPATENIYAVNTAVDGSYTITNVPAGTYQVRVDTSTLPAGFNQTGDPDEIGTCTVCNSHHQVVLAAGENYTGADFGYQQQNASIGDLIWNDEDGDGVRDASEPGIVNVRVYLDTSGDGSYQVSEPTALTNASGIYTISDLAAGTYRVRVDTTVAALSGFGQTGDPDQPSAACTTCDNQHLVTLSAGQNYTAADFGYHEGPISLSKTIFTTDPANVANTSGNNVTIGEIVVYQIQASFAPGVYPAATITDILERGLAYVGCNQGDQSDGGLTIANFTNLCADHVLVSRYPAASASDVDDGRQIVFDLGDVENTSSGVQTLTLRYQVVVLNILQNDRGDELTNSAYFDPQATTSAPDVIIVEPTLDIEKTADLSVANPGDLITFKIEISHMPASDAHAYDVVVTDSIPAGLIYEPGTLQPDPDSPQQPTSLTITNDIDIEVVWDVFLDDDTTSAFTFQARMNGVESGQTVVNIATAEWTSLMGEFRPGLSSSISPYNTNWSYERWYDPDDQTGLNGYGGITSSVTVRPPSPGAEVGGKVFELPGTGFAPGRVTRLPRNPGSATHQSLGNVWLEIPSLGVKTSIVGVPLTDGGWDVTWLWNQVGHLEGTAFPTVKGNTVITGHVYLPNGLPGPFVHLKRLSNGDEIIIHAFSQRYVYRVRERHLVNPYSLSVFKHQEADWVTLLTCSSYDENTNTYRHRFYVQAVLVSVDWDIP